MSAFSTTDRLLFRRQFLLGPEGLTLNEHWNRLELAPALVLSVHRDLPYEIVRDNDRTLLLLGIAVHPFQPLLEARQLLELLLQESKDFEGLLQASKPLAGRWILLLNDASGTHLFTDPCGFRTLFYHRSSKGTWCASQPELIRQATTLKPDQRPELVDFMQSASYQKSESAWVGDRTPYEECFHLMPNHYLDLDRNDAVRFFPEKLLEKIDAKTAVQQGSEILKGILKGLWNRFDAELALTAGLDSRVLLAASRSETERLKSFVYQFEGMTDRHPDVRIPRKIAKKVPIPFQVRKLRADSITEDFFIQLERQVTGARRLPKTGMIHDKLESGNERITINGNGSEIARLYFDPYWLRNHTDLRTDLLADCLYGKGLHSPFVLEELENWKQSLGDRLFNYDPMDLLYWEQRMGNWGAQFPAEQDIATEEISPFNCRLLLEILLSTPKKHRKAPDFSLYRKIIQQLWPELLSEPINPPQSLSEQLKNHVRGDLSMLLSLLPGRESSKKG